MTETDAEFVERMENDWVYDMIPDSDNAYRLFALARRGAEAAAEVERLRAALRYIAWEQKEGDEPHLIARAALLGGKL